jgi:ribosomal protein S18 acetylase RimI-like enzyme
MAALSDAGIPNLVHLRHVSPAQLEGLLAEETQLWKECLDWDFRAAGELIRRFIGMRSLNGYALFYGDTLAGYSYYVCEDSKGLVGDLFVRSEFRSIETENMLLEETVGAMWRSPHLRRVEAQLMLFDSPLNRPVPFAQSLSTSQRDFMEIDATSIAVLPPRDLPSTAIIEPWTSHRQEKAAQMIADAYRGHLDSDINDQYRSLAGARRFLLNIVQYPGCGTFFGPGSCLALHQDTQELAGLSLASLVSADVGHITQICVSPDSRGQGFGYELLRHSLDGLLAHGCRKVSLTVTTANREAIDLYLRTGFTVRRSFAAYVWEGFR